VRAGRGAHTTVFSYFDLKGGTAYVNKIGLQLVIALGK
jgi:hypothetical protein